MFAAAREQMRRRVGGGDQAEVPIGLEEVRGGLGGGHLISLSLYFKNNAKQGGGAGGGHAAAAECGGDVHSSAQAAGLAALQAWRGS